MGVKYNLVAKTGEYTNDKGETKARWSRVGVVLETSSGGMAIKIENIPLNWDGFANMAEPDAKDGNQTKQDKPKQESKEDFKDDIPF